MSKSRNKSQTLLKQTASGHIYSTMDHECSDAAVQAVSCLSSDPDGGVCVCVCWEKQISVGRGCSIVQHGFCWQK